MNCNCDFPARYIISRDGKPCFTCGLGRCRFYALAPVQCDGYTRYVLGAPGSPPVDVGVVFRFEALVHPDHKDVAAFTVRVQGDAQRWDAVRREVLQDPQFEGMWYTTAKAFLYPMAQYQKLVAALKARRLPHTALEEIPAFYLRCVERMQQIPAQFTEAVTTGRARRPDVHDCVFRQLKPFQRDGVRFVIEHDGRAMIADDMGLGKTVQAIAVAHHYRDEWPVLVVCPMSLLENWAKEFNKFCGIPYTRIAILQGTKAKATSLQDVVIVSYNSLKCVEEAHFKVVILDESHYIKAGVAKRAQTSLKLCRESRRVLLLSGTPAMSRPIELYAQLQAIQPTVVPSKTNFAARYCNSYVSRFGIDVTGHSHTDELHSLLRHFVIRRTKKELGDELPSKSRQLLYVYITEKEKKALEKQIGALRRSLATSPAHNAVLEGGGARGGGGGAPVDLTARAPNAFEMKMATARAKIPAVQDYVGSIVEQHLDSGEKLILFAHHQCMMEALKAAVEAVRPRQPIDYIYISGETPASSREPLADHFRTEPTCTVAILSMQSSGTGHNFTCASTVVFTELDWNPSTHLQCEDRVHRIGQAQPCHIKYLLAEGTSDSVIWPLLQTKLSVTTAMFENVAAAAEVHLHDGADKQSVARRDVTVAGAAPSTARTSTSTPSSSQQSTLDRFFSSSQAQASKAEADDPDVVVASSQSARTPRDSLDAAAPLLTPTDPSQRLSPSHLRSPLSLTLESATPPSAHRGREAAAAAKPAVPLLVVPFSEMGNAFAGQTARPPKPSQPSSTSSASPSSIHLSATTTAANAGGPGNRKDRRSSEGEKAGPSAVCGAATTSPTSVLDLMRQTSTKTPAAAAGIASGAPVVVDLTEDLERVTAPVRPPPSAPPHSLSSSSFSSPPPPPAVLLAASTSTPPPPPSRRTVFTFGPAKPSSPPPALPAAPAPLPSSDSTSGGTFSGVSSHSSEVSAPPAHASAPIVPSPTVASVMPPSTTTAVHIPIRSILNFKRPRAENEAVVGRTGAGAGMTREAPFTSHVDIHSNAPPGSSACANGRREPAASVSAAGAAPQPILSGTPVASATLHTLPTVNTHNVASQPCVSSTVSDFPFPVPLVAAGGGSGNAPPRRTLFKLVSNTPPAHPPTPAKKS